MVRTQILQGIIVASLAALTGCTAGEVVAADGSNLTGYSGPSTITFKNSSTGTNYTVSTFVNGSGVTEFSFDPYGPSSSTNGPYIPAGTYTLDLNLCTDATHCMVYGNWSGFSLAYNQTCTDTYTNNQVPCALFKIVRCQFPADYSKYGSLCTQSSVSGGVTTVGVLDGP
jgi:hypothetical protein